MLQAWHGVQLAAAGGVRGGGRVEQHDAMYAQSTIQISAQYLQQYQQLVGSTCATTVRGGTSVMRGVRGIAGAWDKDSNQTAAPDHRCQCHVLLPERCTCGIPLHCT